jgi:hypothetical protein
MAITSLAGKTAGYAFRLAMGAAVGLAWLAGSIGIILSPLLILVVGTGKTASIRWIGAFGYFLSGAAGLPGAAATFFGPRHDLFGHLLWLSSAAVLALPWAIAANGWRTITAILVSTLPPLGIIGWLSPITAAGLWFPGMAWAGLLLTLGLCWTLAENRRIGALALGFVSIVANVIYRPPCPPPGWIGVNTQVGPASNDLMEQYARLSAWISQARRQAGGAKVVVLPETVAADDWDGTRFIIGESIPPERTWLVGASIRNHQGLWDAVLLARKGRAPPDPVFTAVLPLPVSMWKPWALDGYKASWWQEPRTIEGQRTLAVICYDQLLVWPWLEALLQRPSVIIAPSNGWWARGSSIPAIEAASTLAWSRLMAVPIISARNTPYPNPLTLNEKIRLVKSWRGHN